MAAVHGRTYARPVLPAVVAAGLLLVLSACGPSPAAGPPSPTPARPPATSTRVAAKPAATVTSPTVAIIPSVTASTTLSAAQPTPVPEQLTGTPKGADAPGVLVAADLGDNGSVGTLKVTMRNDAAQPAWYSPGRPSFYLEQEGATGWQELNLASPAHNAVTNREECLYAVSGEPAGPAELPPGVSLTEELVLDKICLFPLEPSGVPAATPQPLPPGSYRVKFFYGLDRERLSEYRAYSEPFSIHP